MSYYNNNHYSDSYYVETIREGLVSIAKNLQELKRKIRIIYQINAGLN